MHLSLLVELVYSTAGGLFLTLAPCIPTLVVCFLSLELRSPVQFALLATQLARSGFPCSLAGMQCHCTYQMNSFQITSATKQSHKIHNNVTSKRQSPKQSRTD